MRGRSRRFVVLFSADSLALAAAGCGGGGEGEEGGLAGGGTETGGGVRGGTLVFGAAADPLVLDGALVSDVDSIRVIAQLFEMLLFLKPGTLNRSRASPRAGNRTTGAPHGRSTCART